MKDEVLLCLGRAESAIEGADFLLRHDRELAVANRAYYAFF